MMPAKFAIISDDEHKAFININMICMFRYRQSHGKLAKPAQVEIEFVGGGKTKLHGETAIHFISAITKSWAHKK
jgi:hypothetical protein